MSYKHIFVAGTFDGLHQGHEAVLTKAFQEGEKVTVGITSPTFIERYKPEYASEIRSFEERKTAVEFWIDSKGYKQKADIITIEDPYDPAGTSLEYDSLIVTTHNITTGETINGRRMLRGLNPLSLIEVPLVPASDGSPISSTRMREGEIDSEGKLLMPETLRPVLKEPFGRVIPDDTVASEIKRDAPVLITVGDYTTKQFRDLGIMPSLAIIDLLVKRVPYVPIADFQFPEDVEIIEISSGPGFISTAASQAISEWGSSKRPTVLIITGEDDLLVLPAVESAPLGAVLYYGQPNAGLVEVSITEEVKSKVKSLLGQFKKE